MFLHLLDFNTRRMTHDKNIKCFFRKQIHCAYIFGKHLNVVVACQVKVCLMAVRLAAGSGGSLLTVNALTWINCSGNKFV